MVDEMNYYIGLDSGGTFMKAALFDAKGRQIALSRVSAQVINSQAGWVERELDALWEDAKSAISKLLAQTDIAREQIRGISISAQGKGVYLLDKHKKNLRNGIMSSDSRSLSIVKAWQEQNIPEKIYPITLQTLWTGHPVSILRWLKEHEPDNYKNIGAILMAHDYLRFRFTGECHAELTNISESNLFNAHTGSYDPELLDIFGINEVESALMPVLKSHQIGGYISQSIAKETGLAEGTPVFAGLFDVVSTAICSGINAEADSLNYVMGTWSVTSGITSEITKANHNFVYGHYIADHQYIIHEASPTSASNYEWFVDYLGQEGKFDHQQNQALVAALPAASTSLYFVPFLYGSNMGLGIKSGFYGLQAHHNKGHIIQAIWEGILFCHNVHLDRMRLRFPNAKSLKITGGPSSSLVWMQMLADLTGLKVELSNVNETGALGAALIAMVGAGEYASIEQALSKMEITTRSLMPNPENFQKYQDKYKKYLKLVSLFKSFEDDN